MIEGFDWRNPDYAEIFAARSRALKRIRESSDQLFLIKAHYRENPIQFISDWGMTYDPRNIVLGRPSGIPFVLFPRQVEFLQWVMDSWRGGRPGVCAKSRESGVSWLALSLASTLCLFNDGMTIGFGSRKAEYVDKIGSPKSLFWKARYFLSHLPPEFRGGFNERVNAPEMRLTIPETGSVITGEGGDNIGRGDRSAIYFVDESAFLEHPELADASLSQTTPCRIDVSTPNGLGNPFHQKVTSWEKERVFLFHWRDDPRKDQEWYDKQVADLSNPVVVAQELDIDFAASVEGVLIPSAWVHSALDAHVRLGIEPSGMKAGALDVADEGRDLNAFCGAHGIVIERIEEWSGKGSDIYSTVVRAFDLCDELEYAGFLYDSDGLGAGARGDGRIINEQRGERPKITLEPFRGSESPAHPEQEDVKGRKNKDFFANRKAQGWWRLRQRFQATHRAIQRLDGSDSSEAPIAAHDDLISISSKAGNVQKLMMELSQPTYSLNGAGKIIVDKVPDGARSPNLGDGVMIRFSGARRGMVIQPSEYVKARAPMRIASRAR